MKKILLTCLILPLLSACGFSPVYGTDGQSAIRTEANLQNTEIGNIPNYEGQYLRNALIDRFYRNTTPQNTRYRLTVAPIKETKRDMDVTVDSDTTRAQLRLSTSIKLQNKATGQTILERSLRSTASYNVLGSEYTNQVSEDATRRNVLDDLARQIERELTLYFNR